MTRPLTVRLDPRIQTPEAGVKLQHDTSRAIDAALRRVAEALTAKRSSPEGLARVQGQLTQLFGIVETTDAVPTSQTMAAVTEALAAAAVLLKQ